MARSETGAGIPADAARLALAFAPWFAFWGLIAARRPGPAAPFGALAAGLLLWREARSKRLRFFTLFTGIFLALAALLGVLLGPSLSDRLSAMLAGGFFFLLAACVYGLLQHDPFPLAYLDSPGEDAAPFRKAAVRISLLWSSACLYCFVVTLIGMGKPGQAGLDFSIRLALWPLPAVLLTSLSLLVPWPEVGLLPWGRGRSREPENGGEPRLAPEPEIVPAETERPRRSGSLEAAIAIAAIGKPRRSGKPASRNTLRELSLSPGRIPSGYTVAVVGGGLGGLVCGALLARAGAEVILSEQHAQVGGYFNSYRTRGFLFDVGPHMALGTGSGLWAEINHRLGVDGLLDNRRLSVGVVVGETALRMPESLEEFTGKLVKRFPAEKKGLYRVLADLESFGRERSEASGGELLPPEQPREMRRYLKSRPRACAMASSSFADYLGSLVSDPMARSAWASLTLLAGEEASAISAAATAEAILSLFEEGGYCLGGGNLSYTAALADIILAAGGSIMEGQGVREVLLSRDGESARGMILEDGTVIKSDAVVSDAGLVQTARHLVRAGALDAGYLKWVDSFEPSPSSVVLYLALEGDLNLPDHIFLIPSEPEYVRLPGASLELSSLVLSLASQADPSRARPGHHTVTLAAPIPPSAFAAMGSGSDGESLAVQITAAAMQRMALTVIPDLYERLVFQEIASPLTLHRLTRSFKGAAFGVRQSPGMKLMERPGVKSPLGGLWLVGADTRYGTGARGAVLSALAAYRGLVADIQRVD